MLAQATRTGTGGTTATHSHRFAGVQHEPCMSKGIMILSAVIAADAPPLAPLPGLAAGASYTIALHYTAACWKPPSPSGLLKSLGEIRSFAILQDGWDGFSASPPAPVAMSNAKEFLRSLDDSGRQPDRVAPSTAGGVGITCMAVARMAYVEFYNSGAILVAFDGKDERPQVRRVAPAPEAMPTLVDDIADYLDG